MNRRSPYLEFVSQKIDFQFSMCVGFVRIIGFAVFGLVCGGEAGFEGALDVFSRVYVDTRLRACL